jgi:hypothetical protein
LAIEAHNLLSEMEANHRMIKSAFKELLKHGSKEAVESCYGDGKMGLANAIRKTIEAIKEGEG